MGFLDSNGLARFYDGLKSRFVRTINGVGPDSDGNVNVSGGGSGTATVESITNAQIQAILGSQASPVQVVSAEVSAVILAAHPVGSYYWSDDSTSPASLFGGTWEPVEDKFILSAGQTYTAGDTGGEAEHTLTTDEMPAHNHSMQVYTGDSGSATVPAWSIYAADRWANSGMFRTTSSQVTGKAINSGFGDTANKGGGQAHNNLPPYLVSYCWHRIA